jgi:hypothetical protein
MNPGHHLTEVRTTAVNCSFVMTPTAEDDAPAAICSGGTVVTESNQRSLIRPNRPLTPLTVSQAEDGSAGFP